MEAGPGVPPLQSAGCEREPAPMLTRPLQVSVCSPVNETAHLAAPDTCQARGNDTCTSAYHVQRRSVYRLRMASFLYPSEPVWS